MTVKKTLTIKNELGLHARAAGLMVQTAGRYKSKICLERDGRQVDGRSLLGILTLFCPKGSKIVVQAEGEDAREALADLERLVENKFGED